MQRTTTADQTARIHRLVCTFVVCIWHKHVSRLNKMARVPSKDSYQPGHLPSLIRVFAVHMKKAWILSYPLSEHSDQAGWMPRLIWVFTGCIVILLVLSLIRLGGCPGWSESSLGTSHFVGFVMRWLMFSHDIAAEKKECDIRWQQIEHFTWGFSFRWIILAYPTRISMTRPWRGNVVLHERV